MFETGCRWCILIFSPFLALVWDMSNLVPPMSCLCLAHVSPVSRPCLARVSPVSRPCLARVSPLSRPCLASVLLLSCPCVASVSHCLATCLPLFLFCLIWIQFGILLVEFCFNNIPHSRLWLLAGHGLKHLFILSSTKLWYATC